MTDGDAFNEMVTALDYPMFVVTTRSSDESDPAAGCLVGFASQTSIRPPRFIVGLSRRNFTFRIAQHASHLAVHVLNREHLDVVRLFGEETGDRVDKFAQCQWRAGPFGMPILTSASAWFVGRIRERFDVGDHVGHLLDPVAGEAPHEIANWVSFADVRSLEPGHEA